MPVFLEIRYQQPDGLAGLDQLSDGGKEFNGAAFYLAMWIKQPSVWSYLSDNPVPASIFISAELDYQTIDDKIRY